MNVRVILTVLVSLLDEVALVVLVLWGLPLLGIHLATPWIVLIMLAIAGYGVLSYRIMGRILRKKQLPGMSSMVDMKGKTVSPLEPEGMVKIEGELWEAETDDGKIPAGDSVVVVGQEGLKLCVREDEKEERDRKKGAADDAGTPREP